MKKKRKEKMFSTEEKQNNKNIVAITAICVIDRKENL